MKLRTIILLVPVLCLLGVLGHMALTEVLLVHKIVVPLLAAVIAGLWVTTLFDPGEYLDRGFSDFEDEIDREKLTQLTMVDFDSYAGDSLAAARTAFQLAVRSALDQGADRHEAVHTALAHAVADFAESMCVQMDTYVTGSAMTDEPIDGIGQAVFKAYDNFTS